jgi:hypothetical protein
MCAVFLSWGRPQGYSISADEAKIQARVPDFIFNGFPDEACVSTLDPGSIRVEVGDTISTRKGPGYRRAMARPIPGNQDCEVQLFNQWDNRKIQVAAARVDRHPRPTFPRPQDQSP